jgi:hypothetical protein
MKRLTFLTSIAAASIVAAAPALAAPGGSHGGGDRGGGLGAGINAGSIGLGGPGGMGTTMREMGRENSRALDHANPKALDRVNSNSVLSSEAVTGTRIPDSATKIRGKASAETRTSTSTAMDTSRTRLTGVETGMAVVDTGGATVGTVTGVTTKGNGSIRTVQVTLTSGQIITLSPNGLTLNDNVLTTASTTNNVQSQGAAHASVNGLTHASSRSALASAGVTSLTGLAADLTVNNSVGDPLGTVGSIVTNRSGAVIGINLDLTSGGTVFVPATTLSMNGTTVVTSSTQF